MLAGFAGIDWTPEPGLALLGQMHRRIATHARDPLMATAAAFRQGTETAVLVSVDIALLDPDFIAATQQIFSGRTNIAPQSLLVHCTHTHVAPSGTHQVNEPPAPGFLERLQEAIVGAAECALSALEPVSVHAGTGHVDEMGWNRRAMFDDGGSRMYGNSEQPGFIGMEGPRDPALPVLWTRNAADEITGVIVNFSTHPNTMEGECFYSADLPGATRKYLKRLLGSNVTCLYLTGASGNTAPSILDPHNAAQPWRGDAGCERSGLYLAGEAAKVIASGIEPMKSPQLRSETEILDIELRSWPQPHEKTSTTRTDIDYYVESEKKWPRLLATGNPDHVRLTILRIGDAAICTNPAELFVEFGLQIREDSPARVTFVAELTDGYSGYIPTPLAFSRGGYETWTAPTSRLHPDAGDRIVAATRELLNAAFPKTEKE